ERAQAHGMLETLDRFVGRASPDPQEPAEKPCRREIGVQHQCPVEKIYPSVEIAGEMSQRMTAVRERHRVVLPEVDCRAREAYPLGGFPGVVPRPAVDSAPEQAPRGHPVGGGVIGVEVYG